MTILIKSSESLIKNSRGIWNPQKKLKPAQISFQSLGYNNSIKKALRVLGIYEPSQPQTIVSSCILRGLNTALRSLTGSGKTIAYLLPLLAKITEIRQIHRKIKLTEMTAFYSLIEHDSALGLVIAPTADLAFQIVRAVRSILPNEKECVCLPIIGGTNLKRQLVESRNERPLILVGTPGRVADMNRQARVHLHRVHTLIIDEADLVLNAAYREDMELINKHLGIKIENGRQNILVSATLTTKSLKLAKTLNWFRNKIFIFDTESHNTTTHVSSTIPVRPKSSVKCHRMTWNSAENSWKRDFNVFREGVGGVDAASLYVSLPPNLIHVGVECHPRNKLKLLNSLIETITGQQSLVFVEFQRQLRNIKAQLLQRGTNVEALHGSLTAQERKAVIARFNNGRLKNLVTSDLATRGIDLPCCNAIFNLEPPSSFVHYAHRAGRAGRGGRKGVVITFYSKRQKFIIDRWKKDFHLCLTEIKTLKLEMLPVEAINKKT